MKKGKKRGPKTDNPKNHKISIKLDAEAKEILDNYCEKKDVSASETARRGIKKLKDELEE